MSKVELEPAHRWECPDCKRLNFASCIPCEFTNDEIVELKYEHGIDPLQGGEFLKAPKHVVCEDCFGKFETALRGDDEDE